MPRFLSCRLLVALAIAGIDIPRRGAEPCADAEHWRSRAGHWR